MTDSVLIAGGGIAGLAAAVGLARAGWQPTVCERAPAFSEVGAGVQLGPNVTRILRAWGAEGSLAQVGFQPARLLARDLHSGEVLATLSLKDAQLRYGSPYVTVHRADLHGLLLKLAHSQNVVLYNDQQVQQLHHHPNGVVAQYSNGAPSTSHNMAVVADGVWSQLRQQLLNDGEATFTGHVAYRALIKQADLSAALRTQNVTVWMGPHAHVVHYPVRGGEWLNVVCLVEAVPSEVAWSKQQNIHTPEAWQSLQSWNTQQTFAQTQQSLQHALRGAHSHLQQLIEHGTDWRLWPLCGRPPMRGAHEHAMGRVALIGDAAHPMLPYLAQGAGMAIEDAFELAQHVPTHANADVQQGLLRFAQARWQRNARVQQRAMRNGNIFHAQGPVRFARNMGLRMLGARLMDVPWIYGYNAVKL
jgi:salicylate hydroxylase